MGKLLDMISRRSAKAFDAFVEALVETDQEHAAEVLDRKKTEELVRIRDAKRSQNSHTIAQASSSAERSEVAPSSSTVVTTSSSAARVPSPHTSAIPCSTPSGMCLLVSSFPYNPYTI